VGDRHRPRRDARASQEVHGQIRTLLRDLELPADDIPILYGGSVKPDNIDGLMAEPDIDGALVVARASRSKASPASSTTGRRRPRVG
jgi:triosephosphate isomerase